MCDCEELEFEDFEVMLTTLSKKAPTAVTETPVEAPVQVAIRKRNR